MTQGEVAALVGIHQGSYSKLERNTPGNGASAELAAALARIFRHQGLSELHVLYPKRFRAWRPNGRAR